MTDGVIYEEGAPDDIFAHPKQDKTRQFINRLQVFEMTLKKGGDGSAQLFAGIEQFGLRHALSPRLMNRMMTLAEELCVQTILPGLGEDGEIRLLIEVSDTDADRAEVIEIVTAGKVVGKANATLLTGGTTSYAFIDGEGNYLAELTLFKGLLVRNDGMYYLGE